MPDLPWECLVSVADGFGYELVITLATLFDCDRYFILNCNTYAISQDTIAQILAHQKKKTQLAAKRLPARI